MRLESDDISIDSLATSCSTEDLSRTLATLETVKTRKLSDGTEIDENIAVLREAIKRQTESRIYMFHSVDVLGDMMGDLMRDPEGYAVYQRIGERLVNLCGNGGENIGYNDIGHFIKGRKISEVFTGNIQDKFLGVEEVYDVEHANEWDRHETKQLTEDQIEQLEALGVNVRILNILA